LTAYALTSTFLPTAYRTLRSYHRTNSTLFAMATTRGTSLFNDLNRQALLREPRQILDNDWVCLGSIDNLKNIVTDAGLDGLLLEFDSVTSLVILCPCKVSLLLS
jgi:hypothetical protein